MIRKEKESDILSFTVQFTVEFTGCFVEELSLGIKQRDFISQVKLVVFVQHLGRWRRLVVAGVWIHSSNWYIGIYLIGLFNLLSNYYLIT